MSNRIKCFRLMAFLLCAITSLWGCVDGDEDGPPGPAATAREEVASELDLLINALRATGVGDYDTRLGALDWGNATLEYVEEAGHDVLIVPIIHLTVPRVLVARINRGAHGPTFDTAILDFTVDPTTGELGPDVTAKNADGSARALTSAEGRAACFPTCMAGVNFACYGCQLIPPHMPYPACYRPCVLAGGGGCALGCWIASIWPF